MYNSNKVITLSQDTQKIVDRYLALSMGVIQEFMLNASFTRSLSVSKS